MKLNMLMVYLKFRGFMPEDIIFKKLENAKIKTLGITACETETCGSVYLVAADWARLCDPFHEFLFNVDKAQFIVKKSV